MRHGHSHLLVACALLLGTFPLACAEPSSPAATIEAARAPPGPAATAPSPRTPPECQTSNLPQSGLRRAHVEIEGDSGPIRFAIEIAETNRQRNIGMMCRPAMGDDEGMLFVFERDEPRSFWMKNTLLPLDMIFIDEAGRVVGLVERAEPLTLTSRSVAAPSTYVLELKGGTARRVGIREGLRVRFDGVHDARATHE